MPLLLPPEILFQYANPYLTILGISHYITNEDNVTPTSLPLS